MSTSLVVAEKYVAIYCGIPVLIDGVTGAPLNTLMVLGLRAFRQSSCAFYLTIMSIGYICHLFFGLFTRIQSALMDFDGTETSLFYCKLRAYMAQTCFVWQQLINILSPVPVLAGNNFVISNWLNV